MDELDDFIQTKPQIPMAILCRRLTMVTPHEAVYVVAVIRKVSDGEPDDR